MLSEAFVLAFWRIAAWVFAFFGLWLFEIPQGFGVWISGFVALAFFGGLGFFLYKDLKLFHLPRSWNILRRIEIDSSVKHRPLSGQREKLVQLYSEDARVLWEKNKRSLNGYLSFLKRPKTKGLRQSRDRFGLGFAAFVFFGFGIIAAGSGWQERIQQGLIPVSFSVPGRVQAIRVTIVAPDYTNLAPLYLGQDESGATLEIPQGSKVKTLVQGGWGAPKLVMNDRDYDLASEDQKIYTSENNVPDIAQNEDEEFSGSISVRQLMHPKASWRYKTVPDLPPEIRKSEQGAEGESYDVITETMIRIPMIVKDDYSVESVEIMMDLDPEVEQAPLGEKMAELRSVMSPSGENYEISPVVDYSAHTWAGLPVVFRVTARDHLGQTAELEPISMVLPEKTFRHPVAKRLIAMRKELAWTPTMETQEMASEVEEILFKPSSFHEDLGVFLALRSASSRLYWHKPEVENTKSVIALLWDIAVAIEDGNLSIAMRKLRDAQNSLERALRDPDMSQDEISELMSEMRQAMANYMNEMSRELQKQMESGEQNSVISPEMLGQIIDPGSMASFLDQLEQEMREGNMDKVQEMLSELSEMMDGMSSQMAEMPEDMQMMEDGVNELQELIERQEALLDQTQGQVEKVRTPQDFGTIIPLDEEFLKQFGIENMPPAPDGEATPEVNTAQNKSEQEALRLILGQLMLDAAEVLEEIPENMGLAEQEMRLSSARLGENKPAGSVPHQEEAIRQLKEAQQKLSQKFMARMQQMVGFSLSGRSFGMRPGMMKQDPLGRPYGGEEQDGGMYPGSKVKLPNDAEKKRALEILRELRRRSSERDRPQGELEYYRRLLKQF
ncbi:DUF4175 domain-containing protein [Alphaproteobacteria bacterium]|nr:DUF4175 domain-containing protein [Alphaproteobacteria bacterium]